MGNIFYGKKREIYKVAETVCKEYNAIGRKDYLVSLCKSFIYELPNEMLDTKQYRKMLESWTQNLNIAYNDKNIIKMILERYYSKYAENKNSNSAMDFEDENKIYERRASDDKMMKQKVINKQKLLAIQRQASSNRVMARLLSSAENYAHIVGGCKYEIKYGFYDHFNSLNNKTEGELKSELKAEILIFQRSYEAYLKKNRGKYDFPENLNFNDIINDLNLWKNSPKFNKKQKNYYKIIIDILNNNLTEQISDDEDEDDKCDPRLLMEIIPGSNYVIEKRNKKIEDDFCNGKKIPMNINLYGNYLEDTATDGLRKNYRKYLENKDKKVNDMDVDIEDLK